jgi:hypothetical protein
VLGSSISKEIKKNFELGLNNIQEPEKWMLDPIKVKEELKQIWVVAGRYYVLLLNLITVCVFSVYCFFSLLMQAFFFFLLLFVCSYESTSKQKISAKDFRSRRELGCSPAR